MALQLIELNEDVEYIDSSYATVVKFINMQLAG